MEEKENKPLEGQQTIDELAKEVSVEKLSDVDTLTIRKPDEVLQEYTDLQKENESIQEQIEAFKKQYELVFREYDIMMSKIQDNETKQTSLKDEITESMEKSNLATIAMIDIEYHL